jgi:hypothetical protein
VNANCGAFERWLDEGRPVAGAAAHEAHARECARCTALLELESALASPAHAIAPAGFADAVLARVHAAPAARPRRERALSGRVQALLDPAVALALTALALLALERPLLARLASSLAAIGGHVAWPEAPSALAGLAASAWKPFATVGASPTLLAAIGLALAPALLFGSWALFRWTDRVVSGKAHGLPRLAGAASR